MGIPQPLRRPLRGAILGRAWRRCALVCLCSLTLSCGDDVLVGIAIGADAADDADAWLLDGPVADVGVELADDVAADAPEDVSPVEDVAACPDGTTATDDACVPVLPPCTPTLETCNGLDDDCNGLADDVTCSDENACTIGDTCTAAVCLPGALTDCADGNGCTQDSCDVVSGCGHTVVNGPCDDGDACTEADACNVQGGIAKCVGATKSCHDENSCTIDTCDGVQGCVHTTAPVNTACDDDNACTANDVCDHDGNCSGALIPCDDGNPCTVDLCDLLGACAIAPGNGGPCDDGDQCTVGDACVFGVCAAGTLTVCSDGNPCTSDACGSATGQCVFLALNAACDDGDLCSVGDACVQGQCQSGAATVCDDKGSCTDDACDPLTGTCVFTAVHDGLGCDDGAACTFGDVCAGGTCQSGQPPQCDDGDNCTLDTCVAATGTCLFAPQDGTTCDDGNACTVNDLCQAGVCAAGKLICECQNLADCAGKEDGDVCNGTLVCDLSDHTCQIEPATVVTCDTSKNNACLQYVCNPLTGLCDAQNLNDGGKCIADGSACTVGDFCQAGVCLVGVTPGCDDGNACTNDSCDPVAGCQFLANSLACSDGDACTSDDHCAAGACASGPPKNCDDGSDCSADTCKFGFCLHKPLTATACTDGNLCTQSDTCQSGICVPGTPITCPDGAACSVPTCDGTTGKCGWKKAFDGAPCQDSNACTVGDYCLGGGCLAGYIWCASPDTCQIGACDNAKGQCVFSAALNGVACSDGNPCTVSDTCKGGQCQPGADKVCEAGQVCTQPQCDLATGACVANADGLTCDDNNACTTGDHCQNGACAFATVKGCDDNNICTADLCDAKTATCSHVAIAGPCDDGSVCTQADACVGGSCVATTTLNCKDAFDCTVDSCDPKLACLHTSLPGGTTCDDKNDCTVNDQCVGLVCKGTGQTCDDGNLCTENKCSLATGCYYPPSANCDDGNPCTMNDHCVSGKCVSGQTIVCNDGNPCTIDACTNGGGCAFIGSTGASCSDDNACTIQDLCLAGICVGGTSNCDDNNDCTVDQCDPSVGCAHLPTTAITCSDGNACTLLDVCLNGACVSGDVANCDDGKVCTNDACVPATGCVNLPAPGACDDGNFCTGPDVCAGGSCIGQSVVSCDDGEPCTTDVCVPSDGCLNYPVAGNVACNDGNPCTNGDSCKSGLCAGAAVINCNDANYCTLDSCTLAAGCSHVIQIGSTCDDGNLCTVGDVCTAAGACQAGAAGACDDANPCTVDYCGAVSGCKHTPGSTGVSTALAVPGDTQVTVTLANGSTQAAVATWDQFATWTHAVSQAAWLWSSYLVADPGAQSQVAFSRTFTVPAGTATAIGQLAIATDGAFVCLLNGKLVGVNTAEENWLAPISQPLSGKLQVGSNTLVCTLVNPGKPGSTAYSNPAGLLFRIDATLYDASAALPCNDGNACTQGDWCNGGACQPGSIVTCDDANGCTADACDAKLGCSHTANGVLACSDGNPCTVSDTCVGAVCGGGPPTNCNDGNACTADSCAPTTGCSHATLTGGACEDGNPCTVADTCMGATCAAGKANPCDDGNVCSIDGCTLLAGCFHSQASGAATCDDGDPCTLGDACAGATCLGTLATNCNDNNVCTTDGCFSISGCIHTPNAAACTDNNVCTLSDVCLAGACAGSPKPCSDSNTCTADTCDSKTGYCVFVPLPGGACEDGNLCTLDDQCLVGVCKSGLLRTCDDADPCTVDGCVPGSGDCMHTQAATGTACDDGNLCTLADACAGGGCHGSAKTCDDGNPCTVDGCSALSGLCLATPLADGTACPTGTCQAGTCQ